MGTLITIVIIAVVALVLFKLAGFILENFMKLIVMFVLGIIVYVGYNSYKGDIKAMSNDIQHKTEKVATSAKDSAKDLSAKAVESGVHEVKNKVHEITK